MFTPDDILNRMLKKPFVPLRVVTSAGEAFEIYHPDLVLVGERDMTIGFASSKNPSVYDRQTRLALIHITAIEDLPAKAPSGKNGQQ